MISDLAYLLLVSAFISLATFGGGAQALFYQYTVSERQWISSTDLSAVLAFGYATPGPAVFGTATFIGYHVAGLTGAVVGTVGIYAVPFGLALLASRYLSRFFNWPSVKAFIQWLGLAAAGLVAATAFRMAHIGLDTIWWQLLVFGGAFTLSLAWKSNPLYILLAGGLLGLAL